MPPIKVTLQMMSNPKVSVFIRDLSCEDFNHPTSEIGKFYPVGQVNIIKHREKVWKYSILCHICGKYLMERRDDDDILLYVTPVEVQKKHHVAWYSHYEDGVSTQYCRECWELEEIVPTW